MEQLLEIIFGAPEGMTLGLGPLAAIGAGVQLIGGLVGGMKARRQARAMERKQREFQRQLQSLEKNRQAVIDPSAAVQDMGARLTNPFANLQVATQAAEMKAEEADISLANTLDTLRATGAGAAGATALAQAAARSKQGVAADIEKQEARNAQLRAAGEQRLEQMRLQETARVQSAQMKGAMFKFGAQEARDTARLDRLSGLADQYGAQAAASQQQASSMFGSAIGAFGGALTSMGMSGALGDAFNQIKANRYTSGKTTLDGLTFNQQRQKQADLTALANQTINIPTGGLTTQLN